MRDIFKFGVWNVVCDRCGFKRKSDEVVKTWNNLYVCGPRTGKTCWEPRHEQDFVRGVPDDQSVAFTRPQPTDVFTSDGPFNCTACEAVWFNSPVTANMTIFKGIVRSPLLIIDGTTTVVCSLEVRT